MAGRAAFRILLGPVVFLAGCDIDDLHDGTRHTEDFRHTYVMKPGGRLSVENFNGSIEVFGWDKDEVEINGTKYASTKELLNSIKVEITNSADSVQVRTVRPETRRGNHGARYRIHVPRRTQLERVTSTNGPVRVEQVEGTGRLRSSNGGIRLSNYTGDVDVTTSNGPVELSQFAGGAVISTSNGSVTATGVRGHLEATTSNGPIRAEVVKPQSSRPVRLRTSNGPIQATFDDGTSDLIASTSNGPITVKLGAGTSAKVRAHTSHSSITTDFPLNNVISVSKTRVEGTIGNGGPLLDLSTSNGPIRISKLP